VSFIVAEAVDVVILLIQSYTPPVLHNGIAQSVMESEKILSCIHD